MKIHRFTRSRDVLYVTWQRNLASEERELDGASAQWYEND